MYLPYEIPDAEVLITVKTYPLPSNQYSELVCTAGFLSNGKWIRLYPIPFRALPYGSQYSKYEKIKLDVVRNTSDFRPESYRPLHGADSIKVIGTVDTKDNWLVRKQYALKEVFTSMNELIQLCKSEEKKSLATLKPLEIVDFHIEEEKEREWKKKWQDLLLQQSLFDRDENGEGKTRRVVRKLPYKYSYEFLSRGDTKTRKLMIEDWELGALYWRCLAKSGGDEAEANRQVRKTYFDEFVKEKDLYFFLGTTLQFHNISSSPFLIVGVFYPIKQDFEQMSLL